MREETEQLVVYYADDGTRFLEKEKCEQYENTVKKIKFFIVEHTPDLNETGKFMYVFPVAVYSEHRYHDKILLNWCVEHHNFPILGPSVMGFGFQPHFTIIEMPNGKKNDFWTKYEKKAKIGNYYASPLYNEPLFLSPIEIDGFSEPVNYMETWNLK